MTKRTTPPHRLQMPSNNIREWGSVGGKKQEGPRSCWNDDLPTAGKARAGTSNVPIVASVMSYNMKFQQ